MMESIEILVVIENIRVFLEEEIKDNLEELFVDVFIILLKIEIILFIDVFKKI